MKDVYVLNVENNQLKNNLLNITMSLKERIVQKAIDAFLFAGTAAAITSVACLLIDIIDRHDDRIEELFERVEESKSSQDH